MATCPACGSERSPDEGLCAACGEASGSAPEGHESEGHESEGHESEGNESEGNESEGNESEGHESEGHESEGGQSQDALAESVATAVAAPQRFSTAGPSPALRAADRQRRAQVLIRIVILLGVFTNLSLFPVVDAVDSTFRGSVVDFLIIVLISAGVATVAAEVALLSVWWVLTPVSLARRLGYGAATAFVWHVSVALGLLNIGALESAFRTREFVQITCCLPILLLAAALPLWCLRTWLHWRIEPIDEDGDESNRRPLRIVDILIATGLVAVALGLVQIPLDETPPDTAELYLTLSIWGGAIVIASTLTIVPCLWAALRPSPAVTRLVTATAIHAGIALLLVVVMYVYFSDALLYFGPRIWFFLVAVEAVAVYYALLLTALLLARQCGYCLRWRGE
ncbi:MAG: hypothetical protein DWQ35_19130 [Planctomycetota bacterium]|nr:MAG: hypothetical protein DWQ35_19130 [Planctomycetota bacterium]